MPQSRSAQYVLFWYAAETLPEAEEQRLNEADGAGRVVSDDVSAADLTGDTVGAGGGMYRDDGVVGSGESADVHFVPAGSGAQAVPESAGVSETGLSRSSDSSGVDVAHVKSTAEENVSNVSGVGGVVRAAAESAVKVTTLQQRIAEDARVTTDGTRTFYEPPKHEGTGVDEEEALYESCLLSIEEARRKLRGSVMEDVVRRGWDAVKLRLEIESEIR